MEAIFTILALKDQKAPPTINLDNPGNPPELNIPDDDFVDLNFVPNVPQELKMDYALSNSFGFRWNECILAFCTIMRLLFGNTGICLSSRQTTGEYWSLHEVSADGAHVQQ